MHFCPYTQWQHEVDFPPGIFIKNENVSQAREVSRSVKGQFHRVKWKWMKNEHKTMTFHEKSFSSLFSTLIILPLFLSSIFYIFLSWTVVECFACNFSQLEINRSWVKVRVHFFLSLLHRRKALPRICEIFCKILNQWQCVPWIELCFF